MVENQQNLDSKEANKDNIEDYSVVAQRFLNIFRQLHVFTPERKKAFDDMILAQPPDVRSMFGKLIGGNLLQEYVDELEKKSGIASSRDISIPSKEAGTEGSDKKAEQILAKALETTQKTSQVNNQAQLQQLQIQAQLLEAVKNIPSQGAAAPIDPKKLEEIVATIMKSQTELITNVTKAQTEQLSTLIAASLQESYRHSTQSILETIKVMNKDSLEILRENFKLYANNNTPIILSNYNVSNPSGHPQGIAENKTQEIVYEKAPAEFYYEENKNEAPVKEKPKEAVKKEEKLPETDVEDGVKSEKKKKKNKKKNKNKNNNEQFENSAEAAPAVLDYSLFDSDNNNVDDIALDDEEIMDFASEDISAEPEKEVVEEPAAKPVKTDGEPKKEEKPAEEKKESNFISNISKFIKSAKKEEEKANAGEKKAEILPVEETPKAEEPLDANNDEAWEWVEEEESVKADKGGEELSDEAWEWVEEEEEAAVQPEASDEEEWEWVEEETEEPAAQVESGDDEEWEWVEEEDENTPAETVAEEDGEWEWVEEEEEAAVQPEASDEEEWEWVEEETPKSAADETTVEKAPENKENWEWEYEELPEQEKTLVDQEPVTFEEEYVEPEGEELKKPAPISSDGIIDQESIFKFEDDNAADVPHKQGEELILPHAAIAPIQNSTPASAGKDESGEPEDYWRLEEPENNELMVIDGNYDNLNINTSEDELIEGLETVDNSLFNNEDEDDNLYAAAK